MFEETRRWLRGVRMMAHLLLRCDGWCVIGVELLGGNEALIGVAIQDMSYDTIAKGIRGTKPLSEAAKMALDPNWNPDGETEEAGANGVDNS